MSLFQVDFAKVLHYVGAGVAFPTSVLFVCLQSALTYRLAKTQGEYNMGHLRVGMTLLAFVSLVLSILFEMFWRSSTESEDGVNRLLNELVIFSNA